MKQKYFLKIALLFAFVMITNSFFGQGSENFTNSTATSSYADGSFIGNNSITWNYVASRDENSDGNGAGIDGNALMLRRSTEPSSVSATSISGGIGNFSVTLYKGFSGSGNRQVELFINGDSKGTSVAFDDADDKDKYTFTVNNINISGNFDIEIRNITSKQVIVDDITWTAYSSSTPIITFDTATSSQTETNATFNVNIPVTVSNYNGNQIDVSVSTSGTAESTDYTLNTTSLSFTADGSQNISLDINPDSDDFDDETIILTLTETSTVTGLAISQNTHTVTITEDETAPSITFDTLTSSETETDATFTSANIPITVSNYSGIQIDINISVTGGTAEASDYSFTAPTALSFSANGTQNITVDINDDADSDDETIILTITETSSVTGLTISQANHTITVTDNEGPTSIYTENFSGQNSKGAVGPGGSSPTIDLSDVDWTIDVSSVDLSATTDWFQVANEVFEARDIDGNAFWLSPSINISSFTNVQFSLSAIESGDMESADIFLTEYRINGGTWTEASTNGNLNDDFSSATVSETNLNGSTLEIRVTLNNNAGTEYHRLDDILVEGTPASSDPTITFDTATSNETETNATFATSGIPITLTNYDANVTVTATVNGTSTAEAGDYVIDLTPLVFDTNETLNIPLSINADTDFTGETIILDITVTSGTADITTSQHTVTITDDDIPAIFITEIMYDSRSVHGSDDEWIEIYNGSGSDIDISNYTLEYNSITFTFPSSTTFTNDSYIVIAVGSNGDGTFNNDSPFTPDFNNLSVANATVANTEDTNNLTNSSRTIELKNTSGTILDTVTYSDTNGADSNGSSFELVDTSVDNSATSSNWQESGIFGGSPKTLGSSYWTGATSTDWSDATNWNAIGIPTSNSNFVISNGLTKYPVASVAVTINKGLIKSGATLTAQSTFTGTVTYQRNLATTNWYLISSPVSGETYDSDWVDASNIDDTNGSDNNVGIATYSTINDTWSYLQDGGSGTFSNGVGYSVKQNYSGDLYFTGSLNTENVATSVVTGGNGGYNLIGNPFTTNLSSAMFLSGNTANLTNETIWVWNQATSSYDTYVTEDSFILAPTQGFFISANTDTNLSLAETYQTNSTGTFQKSTKTELKLFMTDGSSERYTRISYLQNATTAFDNGYDGETFGGIKNSLNIYTNLIKDNIGKKYQVQSLPNSDYENMIIPIGINAVGGKEITFTANVSNLPTNINVYLEDRQLNTYTRLDETNSKYKITLTEALNGIGRFYLHTASSVLSTENFSLDNISIYKSGLSTLKVVGVHNGATNIKLFNILGKQIINTSFLSNGVKEISLPKLAKGVYIVQLETEKGKLNKKIILE
ncbi:MAG: lamin tail domain-containing protein [Polaribacter sp.]|uniref:lamin tail domain-containing protein n=1 Tax=Polaribacter sp. TaxID=1920175 RepID=UPI0032662E4C